MFEEAKDLIGSANGLVKEMSKCTFSEAVSNTVLLVVLFPAVMLYAFAIDMGRRIKKFICK